MKRETTVTGRNKVSKINFQNIPVHTALGRELRKAFEKQLSPEEHKYASKQR